MDYYSPNEHGRELRGLPPTEISYAAGTDYGIAKDGEKGLWVVVGGPLEEEET